MSTISNSNPVSSSRPRQGPPETIQRRLFVHEYPCMAARGSGTAIVKSPGLFRDACRLAQRGRRDLDHPKGQGDFRNLAQAIFIFHRLPFQGAGPDAFGESGHIHPGSSLCKVKRTHHHLAIQHRKWTVCMQQKHLPMLGARYWAALCLASIFGANMGDFFARNLGLGHVDGLPFLALALAVVVIGERFDRSVHQVYYWTAIIIVRTGATNFADFACGDVKLPRLLVIAGLAAILAVALFASWQLVWRRQSDKSNAPDTVLRADLGYWISMFVAGSLGTVIGD